ncbi:hypothetical protein LTR17_015194 [Elasticomyces elasticus]|nr:hypothetical protein LTR17_015194 [Elasticomyces elasticus]
MTLATSQRNLAVTISNIAGVLALHPREETPKGLESALVELSSCQQTLQQISSLLADYPNIHRNASQPEDEDWGHLALLRIVGLSGHIKQLMRPWTGEQTAAKRLLYTSAVQQQYRTKLEKAISTLGAYCNNLVVSLSLQQSRSILQDLQRSTILQDIQERITGVRQSVRDELGEEIAVFAVEDNAKCKNLSVGPPIVGAARTAIQSEITATQDDGGNRNDRQSLDMSISAQSAALWMKSRITIDDHGNNEGNRSISLLFIPSGQANSSYDLTLPLSPESFLSIAATLDLPLTTLSAITQAVSRTELWTAESGRGGRFRKGKKGLILRAPVSSPQAQENWALAMSWDESHRTVAGVAIGYRDEDFEWIRRHQHRLNHLRHPLQIPLLLIEAVFARDSTELRTHGQALLNIEAKTRLYVWAAAESSGRVTEVDFDGFTKTLNGTTSRLAFHEMRVEGLRVHLTRLLHHISNDGSATDGELACRGDIDLLLERALSLKQIVAYHQRVAQNLVDVVYTMLSQRDNRINRQMSEASIRLTKASVSLARTAKADSSAMKTLALIGTIFLPGTFLSALFSVDGMFNWNAEPGHNVVGNRFWIYWAFTIPITICVVAYFIIFVLVSDKHDMPKKGNEVEEKLVGEDMQRPDPETPFQRVLRRRTTRLAEHEKADMA